MERYTVEELKSITRDNKNKVASSYQDILHFINKSFDKSTGERLFIGKINKKTAQMIEDETDVAAFDKSIVLSSDDVNHMLKHHGDKIKEKNRGQIYIDEKNFIDVLKTIISPSEVKLEIIDNGQKSLIFNREDGNLYVAVTIVSGKKKALTLKSARITKKKQHISSSSDVLAPNPTPKAVESMNAISNHSIPENSENVNMLFTQSCCPVIGQTL